MKYIATLLVAFALVFSPGVSSAQAQVSIVEIVELFITLDIIAPEKIEMARNYLSSIDTTEHDDMQETASCTPLGIQGMLFQGSRNSDVETLQRFLAGNPSWYPEGFVTGYYGPLTTAAVKRYQVQMGMDRSEHGVVGQETLNMLNCVSSMTTPSVHDEEEHDHNDGLHEHDDDELLDGDHDEELETHTQAAHVHDLIEDLSGDIEWWYIGLIESDGISNDVEVEVFDTDNPVVLLLASDEAVTWELEVPSSVDLRAVLYSSVETGTVVEDVNKDIVMELDELQVVHDLYPTCRVTSTRTFCEEGFGDFEILQEQVHELSDGRDITGFTGSEEDRKLFVPLTRLDADDIEEIEAHLERERSK